MNYSDMLERVSESILDLKEEKDIDLTSVVLSSSMENISIYKRNLFGLLLKSFSHDFEVTKKYLGERNFSYFIYHFIEMRQNKDSNILELSDLFLVFIKENYDLHQDDFLEFLATLDLYWHQNKVSSRDFLELPQGMTSFWQGVENGLDCSDLVVNFEMIERVQKILDNNEKRLVIMDS